jgi:ADP-heptose:LPS heptosyltransferase
MIGRWGVALVVRAASLIAPLVDGLAMVTTLARRPGTDVLVVRLDAIGDFLLWLDGAQRLAAHYRAEGRRVTLLANAAWADLAESLGAFDAVWRLDRRRFLFNPRYRFGLMRRLRQAGFDLAIQPTLSREIWFGDAAIRMGGRCRRIGSTGDLANQTEAERRRANRWFTELVAASASPLMELERNAEFLRGLGIAAEPAIGRLPVPAPRQGGEYFVVFPGAGWDARCWSPAAFAELAERVSATTGWRGVIAGGSADRAAAMAVAAATSLALENKAGATTLLDLATLLKGARLVLSNETSAVHLAAVVGTPSVCILGGGHFGRFLPYRGVEGLSVPRVVHQAMPCYGCNWRCCHPRADGEAFACIRAITVDQAWDVVAALLPPSKPECGAGPAKGMG